MTEEKIKVDDFDIGSLLVHHNKTLKVIKVGEGKAFKQIGNFALEIIAKGEEHYLIDINGRREVTTLDFTTNVQRFRQFIRPYIFTGSPADLETLTGLICEDLDAKDELIYLEDRVGKYTNGDITFWIFRNQLLLTHQGGKRLEEAQVIPLPQNKVFQLGDSWLMIKQEGINNSLIPIYKEAEGYALLDFLSDFLSQLNNQVLLCALLGWFIASIYLEEVSQARENYNFPFFFITAETETGKTALLSNCIRFFGMNYIGENFAHSVTPFVEMLEFAQVSNIPIWRDEYKNEKYALQKEGWLRSVFTRSMSSRGTANQGTKRYPTRATLLLSGEDITEDPALYRRMIRFRMRKEDKVSAEQHEINTYKANEYFAKAFPLIIKQGFNQEVFKRLMAKSLSTENDKRDELMCYAAIGAIFGEEIGAQIIEDANKYHEMTKEDVISQKDSTADRFFLELNSLFTEKGWFKDPFQMPKVLDYFAFANDYETAYFRFSIAHPLLKKYKARDEYQFSPRSIGQLIQERYQAENTVRRFRGENSRVMSFKYKPDGSGEFWDLIHKVKLIDKAYEQKLANAQDDTSLTI